MERSRFSEGQIIGSSKEGETGSATSEICGKHGIREQPYSR